MNHETFLEVVLVIWKSMENSIRRRLQEQSCSEAEAAQLREQNDEGLLIALAGPEPTRSLLRQLKQFRKRSRSELFQPNWPKEARRSLRQIEESASRLPDNSEREQILTCVREGLRIFE